MFLEYNFMPNRLSYTIYYIVMIMHNELGLVLTHLVQKSAAEIGATYELLFPALWALSWVQILYSFI